MADLPNNRFLSTGEVLKRLDIPSYRLDYLFKSRKLKKENFITLGNGQIVYRESDLSAIKEALFSLQR